MMGVFCARQEGVRDVKKGRGVTAHGQWRKRAEHERKVSQNHDVAMEKQGVGRQKWEELTLASQNDKGKSLYVRGVQSWGSSERGRKDVGTMGRLPAALLKGSILHVGRRSPRGGKT